MTPPETAPPGQPQPEHTPPGQPPADSPPAAPLPPYLTAPAQLPPDSPPPAAPGQSQPMQAQPPQGQAPQGQPMQGVPAPGAPVVPPVPAGPGVRPPFAAPPVQKAGGTLALGLILGGFAVLLCLVGGGIGIGVAVFSAFQDTDKEARAAAGAYLDAISEERYAEAYQMTCTPFRKEVDEQEFVATKQRGARIVDYELSSMVGHEAGVMVPARISLEGGDELTLGLVLAREPVDGASGEDAKTEFRVCGEVKDPGPLPS